MQRDEWWKNFALGAELDIAGTFIKTGRELFDELQPMGLIAKPPVETVFHSVATRAEFVALLRAFEDRYRADGIIPLLQIETHGNQAGIGDGEGFDFIELAQKLMPLKANRPAAVRRARGL